MMMTMLDVIKRSASLHPTLFAEVMLTTAQTHDNYSRVTHCQKVQKIARDMANELRVMARDMNFDNLTLGETIQAFEIAARLQCLPPSLRKEIAAL